MKTKLVPAEMYARMMSMDMSEIARYLEETQYKDEIDALSKDYSGVELIEHATFANMANTFRKLERVSIDEPSFLILEYLRRWDVWNIKDALARQVLWGIRHGYRKIFRACRRVNP